MFLAHFGLAGNVSNCDGAWAPWPRCCVSTPVLVLGLAAALPQLASLALWSTPAVHGLPSLFFRLRSALDLVFTATVGGSYCLQRHDYGVHVHHVLYALAMAALHGSCLASLALVLLKVIEVTRPNLYVTMATRRVGVGVAAAVGVCSACAGGVVYASFLFSPQPTWSVEIPIHLGFFALPFLSTFVLDCLLAKSLVRQFGSMCRDLTDEEAPLRRSVFLCVVVTSFVSFMVYPFLVILFLHSHKCVSEVQITTHVMVSWVNFALCLFIVEPFQRLVLG